MVERENLFFVKVFVNCYWKYFFCCGLIEFEDDICDMNLLINLELLIVLENYFCDSEYDFKEFVCVIINLRVY